VSTPACLAKLLVDGPVSPSAVDKPAVSL
jgi:hypothetical protein